MEPPRLLARFCQSTGMDYKGTAPRNVGRSISCVSAFSRVSSSHAMPDTVYPGRTALLLRVRQVVCVSKYTLLVSFQRKFRFPGSLFPLYYETLIEGTRSVIFLSCESRETRHFYATLCEVYLGRISISYKSKLCVYLCMCIFRHHSLY